jgi:hypothetical protein
VGHYFRVVLCCCVSLDRDRVAGAGLELELELWLWLERGVGVGAVPRGTKAFRVCGTSTLAIVDVCDVPDRM